MKWLLLIGGALVLLIVIMAVIGAMLPQAHTATRSERFPGQTPETLFPKLEKLVSENTDVPVEITERVPPQRLVTRIKPGQPFGGSWTITVNGDEVSITENGEVYNPIFRFMSRFVFGHTATMDATLKKLRA